MNTLTMHSVSRSATHYAVLSALAKVGIALLVAVLLGLALETLPPAGDSWSLPVIPAIAANFTA